MNKHTQMYILALHLKFTQATTMSTEIYKNILIVVFHHNAFKKIKHVICFLLDTPSLNSSHNSKVQHKFTKSCLKQNNATL